MAKRKTRQFGSGSAETAYNILFAGDSDNQKKAFSLLPKGLSREERIFVLLLWCGVSGADAYQFAFDSAASRGSCAVMASRLRQDIRIIKAGEKLWDKLTSGKMTFNL